MKLFFLSIALVLSMTTKSQVSAVSLKASGLTCSMCSNAINKALKTLNFIDKVDSDIKNYTFEITFKQGMEIDFDKIKKKVEGAGFSVSGFTATITFDKVQINQDDPVTMGNMKFYFLKSETQILNGITQIKLLNKGFLSSKEYKQSNIPKESLAEGSYYVTL